MRVKTVTFGFTKNLGNFQSARADCTIELGTHAADVYEKAMLLAEAVVYEELEMPLTAAHKQVLADTENHT
jgi:hypothetical protein